MRDVFFAAEDTGASSVGAALRMIEDAGEGVLLYVLPGGRASVLDEFQRLGIGGAGGIVTGRMGPETSGPASGIFTVRPGPEITKGGGRMTPPVPRAVTGSAATASPASAAPVAGGQLRDFGLGAQVLIDLGCGKIRLITNNPRRVVGASGYGLHIVECLPMRAAAKVVPLRGQEEYDAG